MENESKYERAVELVEDLLPDQRLRLYAWLSQRLGWHYVPKVALKQDRFRLYVGIMNDIVGGDIRRRTRERDIVVGRYIVMHRLLTEGCSTEWIGKQFGLSHCTVIHARGMVEEWLMASRMYLNEVGIYRKFNKIIEENGKD